METIVSFAINLLIVLVSSLLWRVRGGLGERQGIEIPCNKIYYALFFGLIAWLYMNDWSLALLGVAASYLSYQLYGWGKYVGAVTGGNLDKYEEECELIDDLLDSCRITFGEKSAKVWNFIFRWWPVEERTYYLWEFPRLYGFLGTSLTGLIMSVICGLFLHSWTYILMGAGMGVCYLLGHLVCVYIKNDGKDGWNWGEWIYGAYLGLMLVVA